LVGRFSQLSPLKRGKYLILFYFGLLIASFDRNLQITHVILECRRFRPCGDGIMADRAGEEDVTLDLKGPEEPQVITGEH
jgi:hypothetical protein